MTPFKRTGILIGIIFAAGLYAFLNRPLPPPPGDSPLIKIDDQGQSLAIWSGPWSCVYDTRTGLLWEVKTDTEDIHHSTWTFSWFLSGRGTENQGDCYFEAKRCDTTDLLTRVNQKKLCGSGDWRLPTSAELLSLVSQDVLPGEALIDKDFFPQVQRGDYWTSEAEQELAPIYRHLGTGALVVNFSDGTANSLPYRNAAFVMLVSDTYKISKK